MTKRQEEKINLIVTALMRAQNGCSPITFAIDYNTMIDDQVIVSIDDMSARSISRFMGEYPEEGRLEVRNGKFIFVW